MPSWMIPNSSRQKMGKMMANSVIVWPRSLRMEVRLFMAPVVRRPDVTRVNPLGMRCASPPELAGRIPRAGESALYLVSPKVLDPPKRRRRPVPNRPGTPSDENGYGLDDARDLGDRGRDTSGEGSEHRHGRNGDDGQDDGVLGHRLTLLPLAGRLEKLDELGKSQLRIHLPPPKLKLICMPPMHRPSSPRGGSPFRGEPRVAP